MERAEARFSPDFGHLTSFQICNSGDGGRRIIGSRLAWATRKDPVKEERGKEEEREGEKKEGTEEKEPCWLWLES